MKIICESQYCTACYACLNTCQHGAIEFYADNMGYLYPHVNEDLCVDCGMCMKTCPINHPVELHHPQKVFAARNIDKMLLNSCASGGISTSLCRSIILDGGVVYGCIAPNYRETYHTRADSIEQIAPMQGSKYVQSIIGDIFRDVKKDLREGKEVIFTGVPCQVAGLKNYLGKYYKNLLTVDLVCHGVSSQKYLYENVQDIFNKYNMDCKDVKLCFRRKFDGPEDSINIRYGLWFDNGLGQNAGIPLSESDMPYNNYIAGFMSELILRENCYACQYAQENRIGDITLADFWGLKSSSSVLKKDGVNLVLVNTEKGQEFFSKIENQIEKEERTLKEAVMGNGRLSHPSKRPKEKDSFISEYANGHEEAYNKALKKYRKDYKRLQIKLKIVTRLRKSKLILNLYNWLKYRDFR